LGVFAHNFFQTKSRVSPVSKTGRLDLNSVNKCPHHKKAGESIPFKGLAASAVHRCGARNFTWATWRWRTTSFENLRFAIYEFTRGRKIEGDS
jgi:hypothetical protein